ncbi:lipase [Bradyrhizobium sp. NAS80.1]|uniref:lipase family protein n=1 Tax=Bradyrhizobium sp. NAS80.1 TaxID=1680159 RepID=UPI000962A048|nr:lipase family protein [Bradyrhizobium sp. NAS80.1]OKO81429.1 lipase [Bradyrhizobium sp. NAS80.1]
MSILVELPPDQYDRNAFAKFNKDAADFDLGVARAMMWMSQLAYETHVPDTIEAVAALWNLADVRTLIQPVKSTLPVSDSRGVIARKDGATIVAFAGTDPLNLLNWVSNFTLGRPNALVHEGFSEAAAALWNDVKAALAAAAAAGSPIFITGHSLGAAIAVVTADFARQQLQLTKAQIYLYGCPRVGLTEFVTPYDATFGKMTYRLVHGADIVPTVPPPQLDFVHVGRYLACRQGAKFDAGQLTPGTGSNEPRPDAGLVAQLVSLFGGKSLSTRTDAVGNLSVLLPSGIGDHLPDRYYAALTPAE